MSFSYIQANTNGHLHDARLPTLSPLNRGFLYGDAVYEVWRSYHGVLFAWEEHWRRLGRSAASLFFVLPWEADEVLIQIKRTVGAFRQTTRFDGDVYVRLQAYRGGGAIGLDPALTSEPGYVILVQPVPQLSEAALTAGLRLSIARDLRRNPVECLSPAWKTGNYLNSLMALREARQRGADDVVMLNLAGDVTEASTSNLAFIDGDRWVTPPLSAGILPGITRELILKTVAADAGLVAEEDGITEQELARFSECMLTSTTKDVQPVGWIDDQAFGVARDSASMRLKAAFAAHTRRYAEEHPGLRLE